jgi:hypothetical protein
MNTDQGAQFTSAVWTDVLKTEDTCISMDGKGRWIDNVFQACPNVDDSNMRNCLRELRKRCFQGC